LLRSQAPELSEEAYITFFLNGLKHQVKSGVVGNKGNMLSLESIQEASAEYEYQMGGSIESLVPKDNNLTVIAVRRVENKKFSKKGDKTKITCKICLKQGHSDKRCFDRPGGERKQAKKLGISVSKLLYQQREQKRAHRVETEPNEKITEVLESRARLAKVEHHLNKVSFCIDSGCTDHMLMSRVINGDISKENTTTI
jgi:hypothetical protein